MSRGNAGGRVGEGPPTVSVLACASVLMVSVERDERGAVRDIHLHPGGQGFWVARMAARLEAEVTLVGPFGGESGCALRPLIEAEGVAVQAIPSGRPNAVWVSDQAEGETATLAELEPPALSRHEADGLFNALLATGLDSRVTVLTGGPPGVLEPERYRDIAHDLRAVGGRVMADLSGPALHAALAEPLEAVKVSDAELVGSGLAAGDGREELLAAARALHDGGAGLVLVSRAERPLLAHAGGALLEIETPAFRPQNHRGAGDSMTGAAAAALARGLPVDAALRLAVAAGAVNVTRRGLGTGDGAAIARLADQVELRPVSAEGTPPAHGPAGRRR